MKHITSFYFTLITLILSSNSFALPDDFKQPLTVEADRVYVDKAAGNAIYEGNVLVKQGSISIRAEQLTMTSSEASQAYDLIYAKGSDKAKAQFRQQLDLQGNMVSGQGSQIFYNTRSGSLEVRNGFIRRVNDTIRADFIKYMMKENVFEAKKERGGRVSMTLQPQSEAQ